MSAITDPSCIEYRCIRILNFRARYIMIHLYLLFPWYVHIFSLTRIPLEKRPKNVQNRHLPKAPDLNSGAEYSEVFGCFWFLVVPAQPGFSKKKWK